MIHHQTVQSLSPFLKWVGGKRWLAMHYHHLFPTRFDRYVEPFLGSAAVFFYLQPDNALLSDSNSELINTYQQVRSNAAEIQAALRRHHQNHNETYYYVERRRKHRADHERAAQFIYLNRVCWNGLYRVNTRGEFNVPLGTKTNVILPTDDFYQSAVILKNANLLISDFEPVMMQVRADDFVFIDPPYVTRHNFNGFVKYNDKLFRWEDQERLCTVIRDAATRGAKILVTNADHPSIRDLYRGVGRHLTLNRSSLLAADPMNRSSITEVAIAINYEVGAQ
jgi:DNA adenine methylase